MDETWDYNFEEEKNFTGTTLKDMIEYLSVLDDDDNSSSGRQYRSLGLLEQEHKASRGEMASKWRKYSEPNDLFTDTNRRGGRSLNRSRGGPGRGGASHHARYLKPQHYHHHHGPPSRTRQSWAGTSGKQSPRGSFRRHVHGSFTSRKSNVVARYDIWLIGKKNDPDSLPFFRSLHPADGRLTSCSSSDSGQDHPRTRSLTSMTSNETSSALSKEDCQVSDQKFDSILSSLKSLADDLENDFQEEEEKGDDDDSIGEVNKTLKGDKE